MILIWKNRGLLVGVYLAVSMLLTGFLLGVLKRNVGGIFSDIDMNMTASIGFLVSAVWTYLVKDDYYRNKSGKRVKMDTRNEFFFISLKVWAYLFLAAGVGFQLYSIIE